MSSYYGGGYYTVCPSGVLPAPGSNDGFHTASAFDRRWCSCVGPQCEPNFVGDVQRRQASCSDPQPCTDERSAKQRGRARLEPLAKKAEHAAASIRTWSTTRPA